MSFRNKMAGAILAPTILMGGSAGYVWYQDEVPAFLLQPKEEMPQELPSGQQSIIVASAVSGDDTGETLGVISSGLGEEVPIDQLSAFTKQAFIDAEDGTFMKHNGVSGRGIVRAMGTNTLEGSKAFFSTLFSTGDINLSSFLGEGGSTITSQVVDLRYMEDPKGLSSFDKVLEQIEERRIAVKMEQLYEKDQILEKYLNSVYFGRGAYGIQSAAKAYFGTSASELSEDQAVMLAAMVTGPSNKDVNISDYSDPATTDQKVREMKNLQYNYNRNVDEMFNRGSIDEQKVIDLKATMEANFPKDGDGNLVAERIKVPFIPYAPKSDSDYSGANDLNARPYVNYVYGEADKLAEETGLPIGQDAIKAGGYIVHTTLNPQVQTAINGAIAQEAPLAAGTGLDAGVVDVGQDGAILGMYGGKDYSESQVNLATSKRDNGSQNKPFVFGEGIRKGMTLDTQFTVNVQVVVPGADNGEDWVVDTGQACDRLGRPLPCVMTLREALAVSSNIVTAEILKIVGIDAIVDLEESLGVDIRDDYTPSLILGTETSPLKMASGTGNLVLGKGAVVEPYAISKITDLSGKVVYERVAPAPKQVLDAAIARSVVTAMKDVIKSGTAKGSVSSPNGPESVAGKTGTANKTTNLGATISVCDPATGGHTLSAWVGNPAANTPIESYESSRAIATILGHVIADLPLSGQACDIAQ